jgi:hypothetical protein
VRWIFTALPFIYLHLTRVCEQCSH